MAPVAPPFSTPMIACKLQALCESGADIAF